MVQYTISDHKFRGSSYDNECELHLCGYRLGRGHGKDGHTRSALNSANSYFKNMIHSTAEAKLRRMRRELELRGIQIDGPDEEWIPSSLLKGKGAK